jgi:hypothetical protein
MQTLKQLRSGELKGIKKLTLCENLTSFPQEIFELAETLEILDLSNNKLDSIPKEISRLKKLKIAFFSNNLFTSVPSQFQECENLYMLGLKANQIETFDEDILPLSVSWLILTDNKLQYLPNSIGKLKRLQKFALAGNRLTSLPDSMAECKNLELLRLSANCIEKIPSWLLELPKLSWLAFSGNPCSLSDASKHCEIAHSDLEVHELLGEGASGEIFRGYSKELDKEVAIKFFKGEVTSDGYAKDEMNACMSVGEHPHLIKVFAKVVESERLGLILEYISSSYQNLGYPPNFDTCTRDTFDDTKRFTIEAIYEVAKAISSAAEHLHSKGLMHGDLYAHNILINDENNCYLGDFGAATFYDRENREYEKIEMRAFGCLLDDMLSRCDEKSAEAFQTLDRLRKKCMSQKREERPLFSEMEFKNDFEAVAL